MTGRIPRLRWLIITLIFCATVINYIDRQTVSVLKTAISDDLGLSNADCAAIQNSFLVLCGISQMVSGRIYDRIGTRLGFVFSIIVWSFAAMMHAAARTAFAFRLWRGVLGFGEAGNWPGAAKAVGEWFPVRERALGMGIFNTGAALGGAVSPPIIAWMATAYGWRSTFVLTGLLGAAWCLRPAMTDLLVVFRVQRLPVQELAYTRRSHRCDAGGRPPGSDEVARPGVGFAAYGGLKEGWPRSTWRPRHSP